MDCKIEGVVWSELVFHSDGRGWLAELFRRDELPDSLHPAMAYVSMTEPGTVRGPHEHNLQSDLFCFLGPASFRLYLWDNRQSSATYRVRARIDIDEGVPVQIVVPAGIVHAYKNTGQVGGLVFNAPNRLYRGEGGSEPVDEIRHEDDPDSPFQVDG